MINCKFNRKVVVAVVSPVITAFPFYVPLKENNRLFASCFPMGFGRLRYDSEIFITPTFTDRGIHLWIANLFHNFITHWFRGRIYLRTANSEPIYW